jgi:prevent-host-death family protein
MPAMTVSEARAALPEILDRVLAGEEVTITRHGREVAVVVSPDALRDLLDRGRRGRLADAPAVGAERADELVADVASGRSAR